MVEEPRLDHLWDGQKDPNDNEKVIWCIGSTIACITCFYKPYDSLTMVGSPIGELVGFFIATPYHDTRGGISHVRLGRI